MMLKHAAAAPKCAQPGLKRMLFKVLLPFPMSPSNKIAQKCKGSKIRHYMLATYVECIMHIVDVKSKQRASQLALHADKRVIDKCLVSRVGYVSVTCRFESVQGS